MLNKECLTEDQIQLLRCPACMSELSSKPDNHMQCITEECARIYPIVEGIPVLIYEENSLFSLNDYTSGHDTYFKTMKDDVARRIVRKLIPNITSNINSAKRYSEFAKTLKTTSAKPQVLVVGGSILGSGIKSLISDTGIEFIESDVSFGPRCKLICDAHDIPIASEQVDGVVAQAVLEHVLDPYRCVAEFHRVLRPGGYIYAETPFMQQVHAGAYDFTRFTPLGHRRLFRMFDEVDSGISCGAGTALAWSYMYFLISFSENKHARKLLELFARSTGFWLKYFDKLLINKPGSLDAASAVYFIGRKAEKPVADRDIIASYKGAM